MCKFLIKDKCLSSSVNALISYSSGGGRSSSCNEKMEDMEEDLLLREPGPCACVGIVNGSDSVSETAVESFG